MSFRASCCFEAAVAHLCYHTLHLTYVELQGLRPARLFRPRLIMQDLGNAPSIALTHLDVSSTSDNRPLGSNIALTHIKIILWASQHLTTFIATNIVAGLLTHASNCASAFFLHASLLSMSFEVVACRNSAAFGVPNSAYDKPSMVSRQDAARRLTGSAIKSCKVSRHAGF